MIEIPEDIIRKAAQGDPAAFEAIYRTHGRFVFNVARRIVRTSDDAEEVTQEVFILLHRKLRSFGFHSSLKTWVYRITINTAINMSKKWTKERANTVKYEDWMDSPVSSQTHDDIDRDYHEKTVDALLHSLTPDHRACIVLRNIEGLSYQEIAEVMNININTVRSRLKRAREVLMNLRKKVMSHEM
ncbi:MAG: sigma-70 family RNA polymerase sigma factor [Candidatus Omnitrophota bacterium]